MISPRRGTGARNRGNSMSRHKSSTARRLTLLAGVGVAVLAFGDVGFSPTRISVPIGGDGFTVEAVRLEGGLVRAAFAQSAITLENVVVSAGPSVYRLPSITFSGASLSRDELLGILRGKGDGPRHEALARISADSVSAPELIVEQTIEGEPTTIVYRDILAEGVVNGVVASLVVATTEVTTEVDGDQVGGTIGETRVSDLDLPFTVRWYTDGAPADGENSFRTAYGSFSMADFAFGDDEATMSVGLITGDAVAMRLMREPFNAFMSDMEAMSSGREPTEEETRRILGWMADMLGSMQLGGFVVEDISLVIAELGDEPVFSIDAIEFGGGAGFAVDTIVVDTEEAQVAIDAITSSGFDIEPMLAGFRAIAEDPSLELDATTARALMPTIGTWRLEGLTADVAPEDGAERIAVSLDAFEVIADAPLNGTPTNVRMSFDALAFALPKKSDDEATAQLVAMGYDALDLSGVFAARWDADASEVLIEEASISGVEMGSFAVSGAFGNIGPEAFAADETAMMMAWLGATAKSVELSIVDAGLADRLLAMQADEQGVPAETLREQGAMMARGMLPAMLGGTPESRALGDALGAFVTEPGELDLVVRSTDPAGIPVMELTMIENPMAFLPRISIEAEAR